MKQGPDMPGWFSCPTTISGPAMGAERHHDSPRLAAAANRKKAPAGTSLLGAKVAIRYTRPKEH